MWYKNRVVLVLLLFTMIFTLVGCSQQEAETINVSAASSLTEVMEKLAKQYQSQNEGTINLNFGGTNTLKTQIKEGFGTDLFLSANFVHYDELDQEDYFVEGQKIAENQLCLVTHKDNDKVTSLEAIAQPGMKLIFANDTVPVGKYSQQVIIHLNQLYGDNYAEKVRQNIVSKESNVRQILTKIMLNEGDAAFVYTTDLTAEAKEELTVIPIPDEYNVRGEYYMGRLESEEALAKEFYDYILSKDGLAVFKEHGFIVN